MFPENPLFLQDTDENGHILTVSELTKRIKNLLEGEFAVCWVVGEISNLKEPSSGHLYFTLKDSSAQLRAVCFRGSRLALRFKPMDGLEVLCFGRVTVYEPRGEYQIIVEYMEPRGVGALRMLFEQLRKKLADEGLFDQSRKKPLPFCPQRILVITSATGAAIRDIITVLRRAPFPTEISVIPVRVQGTEASKEIVKAIQTANSLQDDNKWDLAIIGRGGGSIEDLWVFNEESVVRAIATLRIPSISAVGHEIDVTLADLVADHRALTPTAAAEWVVDQQELVRRNLEANEATLRRAIDDLIFQNRQTLDFLKERLKSPDRVLQEKMERLGTLKGRMFVAVKHRLENITAETSLLHTRLLSSRIVQIIPFMKQRVDYHKNLILKNLSDTLNKYEERYRRALTALQALSPYRVLERGYAIVTRVSDGLIVKSPQDVRPGDKLRIRLAHGEIFCLADNLGRDSGDCKNL